MEQKSLNQELQAISNEMLEAFQMQPVLVVVGGSSSHNQAAEYVPGVDEIIIYDYFLKSNPSELDIRDTIKHEMVHAFISRNEIDDKGNAHGEQWRKKALEVGLPAVHVQRYAFGELNFFLLELLSECLQELAAQGITLEQAKSMPRGEGVHPALLRFWKIWDAMDITENGHNQLLESERQYYGRPVEAEWTVV